MSKVREFRSLAVGFLVVVLMASVALWVTTDANRHTDAVHRKDAQAQQVALAGLTQQFFQLSFKEAFDTSTAREWALTAGDLGDRAALEAFTARSALLRDGAALVSLDGQVITVVAKGAVPRLDDPGLEPMRAGLLAGGPGISSVLATADGSMIAMAVPVLRDSLPAAIFVGLFRPASSPLQGYIDRLELGMDTFVTDSNGTIVVHSDHRRIGTRLADEAFLAEVTRDGSRFVEFERSGTPMVAAVASMGLGGWTTASEVEASKFYAVTRDGQQRSQLAVLGIVLAASGALLVANHRTSAARRRGERRFRALVQNSSDAISVIDPEGKVVYESPAIKRLLGYDPENRVGSSAFDVIHPEDLDLAATALGHVLAGDGAEVCEEIRVLAADGTYRWLEVRATNMLRDEAVRGIVVNSRDITEKRAFNDHLRHMATHDELTDLPNRTLFAEFVDRRVTGRRDGDAHTAVLFLDLDRFKLVNDSFGHEVGDQLLIAVAERLQQVIRPRDVLARISGDEFAILLNQVEDENDAAAVATRVIDAFRRPFTIVGNELYIGVSVGVAMSDPGVHHSGLMRHADIAMYRAKQNGRLRFEMFAEDMGERARQRMRLEGDLRRAVERDEFVLQYQPEIRLSDGDIVGFEALVRWDHPERGMLPPNHFIGLAEDTGLIHPLGAWVLEEACRQAVAWRDAGDRAVRMSVNLSGRQLQRGPEFVAVAKAILLRTGMNPKMLTLEITESVLMEDADNVIATLAALRALGIELAIDDFGTGYSSLAYLKHFPVTWLKLDRSFVHGLADDDADSAIAESMIRLAHALGLRVTAEGVELPEQEAQLRRFNCDDAQGFLFARPLDVEAASKLIQPVV